MNRCDQLFKIEDVRRRKSTKIEKNLNISNNIKNIWMDVIIYSFSYLNNYSNKILVMIFLFAKDCNRWTV